MRLQIASPESWAEAIGLVAVSMFDVERKHTLNGEHAILLDGARGSAAISIAPEPLLPNPGDALSWAWSANVVHSLLVAPATRLLHYHRWDRPGDGRDLSIPERGVPSKLLALIDGPAPPEDKTVISKSIAVFRAIKDEVARRGGVPLDAVKVFNATLAAIASDQSVLARIRDSRKVNLLEAGQNLPGTDDVNLLHLVKQIDLPGLIAEFLALDPDTRLILDPKLLLRHASGVLYQEAHRVLTADRQQWLFRAAKEERPTPLARRDVHFTPPVLARLLTDEAFRLLSFEAGFELRPITFLDPACGSGEFLVEAAHYAADRRVRLVGADNSPESCEMARFVLRWIASDISSIVETDSLAQRNWKTQDGYHPDIILMNPPFASWEDMSDSMKTSVRDVLGFDHHGRPDISLAFLYKALAQVRHGGVVASVLPASFLDGHFSAKARRQIVAGGRYSVTLIGHIRDLSFFPEATVEPAFVVIKKLAVNEVDTSDTVFLEADEGCAEEAIRAFRRFKFGAGRPEGPGWRIFTERLRDRPSDDWKPSSRQARVLERLRDRPSVRRLDELFRVALGARVGNKKAFMLTAEEFEALPSSERIFFMPVADRIEGGKLLRSEYIFFPYDDAGRNMIETEPDLKRLVPRFYERHLALQRDDLLKRGSHSYKWWLLARPRTWQKNAVPRIVSKAFGRNGDFAFDEHCDYAVVQGYAWLWRKSQEQFATMGHAYVALLNSRYFEELLEVFCPKVRGGQFDLSKRHVSDIPLPDLSELAGIAKALASAGRSMASGRGRPNCEALVREAYGEIGDDTEEEFRQLAKQWKEETAHYSKMEQVISHPAYRRVIAMGERAVPLILRDLELNGGRWSHALREITKMNPATEGMRGKVQKIRDAWLKWGRENGFEWRR